MHLTCFYSWSLAFMERYKREPASATSSATSVHHAQSAYSGTSLISLLMQLKAIHLALVTSHRKLEGSYESLRQERVRCVPPVGSCCAAQYCSCCLLLSM
jgi:hypothetical protein